jgi:hypothetical protein
MSNRVDPQKPMALLSIPYGDILLNADDAVEVFKILCKSSIVEYDWSAQAYKLKKLDSSGPAKLHAFPFEEYAKLALTTPD